MKLHSYPDVFAAGHKAIQDLLTDPVVIQEKIDGSQFSFGIIDGELWCRSKGQEQTLDMHSKMFDAAFVTLEPIKHLMIEGYTYRGEYLSKPKHNVRCYGRVPKGNIIIYDINNGIESYLSPDEVAFNSYKLGLETVPLYFSGKLDNLQDAIKYLGQESILGGCNVEGVVIKNYHKFGSDKKVLMGKIVSEEFKEKHTKEWKSSNPTGKDLLGLLCDTYRSEARWQKALQHLRDDNKLLNEPKDIALLVKEVQSDIQKEEEQEIKDALYKWAWPHISRKSVAGLPEWYKQKLNDNTVVTK